MNYRDDMNEFSSDRWINYQLDGWNKDKNTRMNYGDEMNEFSADEWINYQVDGWNKYKYNTWMNDRDMMNEKKDHTYESLLCILFKAFDWIDTSQSSVFFI